ncbi:MAG: gamma-glutamylcyclotransferase [Betaproteobacteria bacterium]|nr:gamma-glutamylcyclotransferase [Betaproteobacteria bacterium]
MKSATVVALKITRASLLNGTLRASARRLLGPGVRLMTPQERRAHVAEVLACAPRPRAVWIFGYGSLMWNPALRYAERRPARIHGFHREFCLLARAGRGSPERPGLMMSLEPGGSCHGVAYRLHAGAVETELDIVWRREMLTRAYRPVWVAARTDRGTAHAIAFAANLEHERYRGGLDEETMARYLASGAGPLGRCCDYLFDTVAHLRAMGIRDRRMEALERRVRALAS